MRFVTYILRSANLLNLILVALAASLATYALYPLATTRVTFKSPAVEQTPAVQEEKPAAGQSPTPSEYVIVAEQNLFHPERKIPVEKTAEAQARPDVILYGTLIADDMRVAYIEDRKSPQSSPGRGVRQTAVKQGQTVSGFLLKSVETDRIVLARGEDQITVYLTDARKTRATATSPQPAVTQSATRPGLATPTQPILRPGTPAPAVGPTVPAVQPPTPAIPSRQQRSDAARSQTGAQAPAATGQNAATPVAPQQGR
jgi:hypothetical protein